MKLEIAPDGTAHLFNEIGRHLGHFATEADAKSWSKLIYGKEGVVKKKDITNAPADEPEDEK